MDEPIPTPPNAAAARAASVLATAPPNNEDAVYPSVDAIDVEEGELEASDLINVPNTIPLETIPEDTPLPEKDFPKKKMSDLFFKDSWVEGKALFLRRIYC